MPVSLDLRRSRRGRPQRAHPPGGMSRIARERRRIVARPRDEDRIFVHGHDRRRDRPPASSLSNVLLTPSASASSRRPCALSLMSSGSQWRIGRADALDGGDGRRVSRNGDRQVRRRRVVALAGRGASFGSAARSTSPRSTTSAPGEPDGRGFSAAITTDAMTATPTAREITLLPHAGPDRRPRRRERPTKASVA